MLFALVSAVLIASTQAQNGPCGPVLNITSTFTFTPNATLNVQPLSCYFNLIVGSGSYGRIDSNIYLAWQFMDEHDGKAQNSEFLSPQPTKYVLNGSYPFTVYLEANSNATFTVTMKKMPSLTPQAVNVSVGAPATLYDISLFKNTSYTFNVNKNYQDAGIAINLAASFNNYPNDTYLASLRSCLVLDSNGNVEDTLWSHLGVMSSFHVHSVAQIVCLELDGVAVTVVVQEANNLYGISTYSTWLLNTFSDTININNRQIGSNEAITIVSFDGTATEVVRFYSAFKNCSLLGSASGPEELPNFQIDTNTGPFDISGNLVTFRTASACSGTMFITSGAWKNDLVAAVLYLTTVRFFAYYIL